MNSWATAMGPLGTAVLLGLSCGTRTHETTYSISTVDKHKHGLTSVILGTFEGLVVDGSVLARRARGSFAVTVVPPGTHPLMARRCSLTSASGVGLLFACDLVMDPVLPRQKKRQYRV